MCSDAVCVTRDGSLAFARALKPCGTFYGFERLNRWLALGFDPNTIRRVVIIAIILDVLA